MASTVLPLILSCVLLSLSTAKYMHCSVPSCAKEGAQEKCLMLNGQLTTCQIWATTIEGKKQCKFNKVKCTGSCYFFPIYGSDGATYCRPCDLYNRACETKFEVTGPVPPPQPLPTLLPTARQGFPALQCSMEACTFFGAAYTCIFKETGQADQEMTCGEYATTSQSQDQCQFVCTQSCSSSGPYDNEGTQYCSLCHLRLASCASDYEIYGPSVVPSIEVCSEEYCSVHGDDAKCIPSRFHTILITCAEWKNSN